MQQENASAATQKVKEGVSSFLGGISKALVIAPDDDYQLAQIVGGEAVIFDRYRVCTATVTSLSLSLMACVNWVESSSLAVLLPVLQSSKLLQVR